MTKQEMIIEVLREHSCLTGYEIKGYVYRMFGENISPQSVAGTLRPLYAAGKIGKSNATGKMAYWLNEEADVV